MKVLYGILNYRRSFDTTKAIHDQIPAEKPEDILILRKASMNFHDKNAFKDIVKKPDNNIAKSKNMILKHAQDNGYDYCFIIEDDMVIKDETCFEKYLTLIDELGYSILFYGFDKRNRVINNIKPNPCLAVRVSDDQEVFASRNPCSSFLLLKVTPDMQMFDERMEALELEFYLWDQAQSGGIQSFGFFPDIPTSWNYFDTTNEDRQRVITQELGAKDLKLRNIDFKLDTNADAFLQFLQERYTIQE
jgi:hypothetical protein